MDITVPKLEFELDEREHGGIPVIVAAAGKSARMQGTDKQLLELSGIPVLIRTLKAFEHSAAVSRIILVTREEIIAEIQLLCRKYMITKLSDIVVGGNDRHSSVMRGIERLSENEDRVLIHDGARPFVTQKMISDCSAALETNDGAVCAVKINDTVKRSSDGKLIETTLDRSLLYAAQTPQGVRISAYRSAIEKIGGAACFTDDSSVLEAAGYSVALVEGDTSNIKITTPSDIRLAQALLEGETFL